MIRTKADTDSSVALAMLFDLCLEDFVTKDKMYDLIPIFIREESSRDTYFGLS